MRLFHVEVDEAGRPVLVKGEQERAMLNNVGLATQIRPVIRVIIFPSPARLTPAAAVTAG